MRTALVSLTIAVLIGAASASGGSGRIGLPDFVYIAGLHPYSGGGVACVARDGDTALPWRLAGIGAVGGLDWAPDGGRFVVAVDTLPTDLAPPGERGWAPVAFRLWRLDRDTMIAQLREHGVPVVRWAGAGSLDQVLRDVARLATAPRVGAR